PDAVRPLAAHEDVPPERLLVGQGPLLVDGLDPEVTGALHREVMDLLALPPDRAGVGRVEAGDDLDQRRLAGAVVPEQADDLVDPDRKADVLQLSDVVERLRDLPELEEGRRRRLHGRFPEFRRGRRRNSCTAALLANPASGLRLPDQPLDEGDERRDVALVDDSRSWVDVEPGELVDLRQAGLEDRQVPLEPLLLVED